MFDNKKQPKTDSETSKFDLPEFKAVDAIKTAVPAAPVSRLKLIVKNKLVLIPLIMLGVMVMILAVVVTVKLLVKPKTITDLPPAGDSGAASSSQPGSLPSENGDPDGQGDDQVILSNGEAVEYLTFGHFYQKEEDNFKPRLESYGLPVNVKIDVSNYYDVARKIDLDARIDRLNQDGFAVLNNPYSGQADDFFSVYERLDQQGLPMLVTSDFLFYYYQNILKQIYKDIERDVFYKNVWEMNRKLFDIASTRYKKRLALTGIANDPVLEGERLAAAYFAVILELLKPTEEQINKRTNFTDENKFSQQEAESYDFTLPDYLTVDVIREVNQIKAARQQLKSPVFFYYRDYASFRVPEEYKNNAKLYNFYLAAKWMNSVFPLYPRSSSCPDCLLDKNDWLINLIAASLIASDFSANQDLKNQWAIIYKVISFFSGLRSDLTYLHYDQAMKDLFGGNYDIEEIFSAAEEERDQAVNSLADKIAAYQFLEAEGGFSRADPDTRPALGMRMLQESYWPDNYILNQFASPLVTDYLADERTIDKNLNITSCSRAYQKGYYRCRGIGLDIVNLISPVAAGNLYFKENTNYSNYREQYLFFKNQLDQFDVYSWHNNNFWTTLNISQSFLRADKQELPVYMRGENWQDRENNTVLGAWINLQLPADRFELFSLTANSSQLGAFYDCNPNNYIEPNLALVRELAADTRMLLEMLTVLKVAPKAPSISAGLKELGVKLSGTEAIIKKELNNEALVKEDCNAIVELVKQYSAEVNNNKALTINFVSNNRDIKERIAGVKLLLVVYNYNDKLFFAAGPIFNYQEGIY